MTLQDWQILRSGRRTDFAIIIAITVIFLFVIGINVRLIFRMTANQTEEIGQTQLEVIRSDFQGTLYQAEGATLRMATEAEQLLKVNTPRDELEKFFHTRKHELKSSTGGICFNVYISDKNWTIIPDFTLPPEFRVTERLWYKGAVDNGGKIFISEPYIDMTGGMMCYSISKLLADGKTVVGLDFNFAEVQRFIRKMSANPDRKALIVTRSGMIIGYNDMELVGEKISDKLPEYENILKRIVHGNGNESFNAYIDGEEHTIFYGATPNGWYIILGVENRALYRDSYRQIFLTIILSLMMMLAIIFFYLNALRHRLQAQTALRVREEFLSRLSRELRDPLKKILDASSADVLKSVANPADKAAEVRESALKLSDMLDNLFSFSNLVTGDKKSSAEKNFHSRDLSAVSNYARRRIIAVLIVAMTVAFGICLTTTISWGDTKMNRQVDAYEHQLATWIEDQRSIVLMFANLLSEHPELMDDYPSAVKFLDDIAKHYPEISVCYLANPYREIPVIMNNGWQPPPEFRPETRPWYIQTESSVSGFSISPPYFDAQTGLYCVTMAKIVFGTKGEFVGIFAVDFYIDSLTQVLGASYTKDSYAFLVDRNGVILNHPNAAYQLSAERVTNIADTEYAKVYSGNVVKTLTDFSGKSVACLAKTNTTSQFTVIVANSWWNIYGNVVALAILFVILPGVCASIINALINRLLRWQAAVNRQLKDASDTALAASQAKSQFLAQMSHEIRTPINAVLGMNEMILRESQSPAVLDYAANIQSAGKTLLSLINSILDFSKIEDGKMEIVPVRYETAALIDDLVHMISDRLKKKSIDLKLQIDAALPKSLYGDDVRLRQIITNLLTNAAKYTHKGSVTLQIGGSEVDADTWALQVAVRDTGIGIRAEDIPKIFQSFQRLDEERNRNIEGTGLGIAIVQKLLGMMDSRLEVASVYGTGSDFSFRLIQKIVDKTPVGDYAERHLKQSNSSARKNFLLAAGAKILVVDDNDMNLKVISGLLKRNRIVPDLADSGAKCLELAAKNFYHIIFLDNMMPVMSGVETLHALRSDKILSDKTSVVMLTANAIAGMREKFLREGFDDYLSKPIDVGALESILERHLPADIVSFDVEEPKKIPSPIETSPVKPPDIEPNDLQVVDGDIDADIFNVNDRKIFADACPDINLETALRYCMDSKSFLIQMLTAFTDAARAEKIQAAFDSGDVKNYQILVHALKSTSLSIGAENLSGQAKQLELAAKADDLAAIQAGHAPLMAAYRNVREQIVKWLEAST